MPKDIPRPCLHPYHTSLCRYVRICMQVSLTPSTTHCACNVSQPALCLCVPSLTDSIVLILCCFCLAQCASIEYSSYGAFTCLKVKRICICSACMPYAFAMYALCMLVSVLWCLHVLEVTRCNIYIYIYMPICVFNVIVTHTYP
jgi:hypothetical protein